MQLTFEFFKVQQLFGVIVQYLLFMSMLHNSLLYKSTLKTLYLLSKSMLSTSILIYKSMLSINLLQYTRICLTGARYERACYTVQEHVTHKLVMKEHVILYKNMLHTSLLCTSMLYCTRTCYTRACYAQACYMYKNMLHTSL